MMKSFRIVFTLLFMMNFINVCIASTCDMYERTSVKESMPCHEDIPENKVEKVDCCADCFIDIDNKNYLRVVKNDILDSIKIKEIISPLIIKEKFFDFKPILYDSKDPPLYFNDIVIQQQKFLI